jgi:protein phosphatase
VPLDVYDTETSEWFKFPSIYRFRHATWNFDGNIFIHGGFEHEAPNIPTDTTSLLNAIRLFSRHE